MSDWAESMAEEMADTLGYLDFDDETQRTTGINLLSNVLEAAGEMKAVKLKILLAETLGELRAATQINNDGNTFDFNNALQDKIEAAIK